MIPWYILLLNRVEVESTIMEIMFLRTPNFELQEFLISLGIPRDSWAIQNHVFRKTREVNPINPLFKSKSFIKNFKIKNVGYERF